MSNSNTSGRARVAVDFVGFAISSVPHRAVQSPDGGNRRVPLPDRLARAKVGSVFPLGGQPVASSLGETLCLQYNF